MGKRRETVKLRLFPVALLQDSLGQAPNAIRMEGRRQISLCGRAQARGLHRRHHHRSGNPCCLWSGAGACRRCKVRVRATRSYNRQRPTDAKLAPNLPRGEPPPPQSREHGKISATPWTANHASTRAHTSRVLIPASARRLPRRRRCRPGMSRRRRQSGARVLARTCCDRWPTHPPKSTHRCHC